MTMRFLKHEEYVKQLQLFPYDTIKLLQIVKIEINKSSRNEVDEQRKRCEHFCVTFARCTQVWIIGWRDG